MSNWSKGLENEVKQHVEENVHISMGVPKLGNIPKPSEPLAPLSTRRLSSFFYFSMDFFKDIELSVNCGGSGGGGGVGMRYSAIMPTPGGNKQNLGGGGGRVAKETKEKVSVWGLPHLQVPLLTRMLPKTWQKGNSTI